MLTNQPHPLISLLVITAAVLITYPLAVRMTNALRPLMEEFLDRRDTRRYKFDADVAKDDHLTVTPPDGTEVVLVKGCAYLSEQGVETGQRGTVVRASRLSHDDNGVVVEWEKLPNREIRMDLHEIGVSPGTDQAEGRLDEAPLELNEQLHLTVTPPNGTRVALVANSDYLRRSLGLPRGRRGTVVMPSNLNPEDDGVLVDWGVHPNEHVRMSLHEIRLAPKP